MFKPMLTRGATRAVAIAAAGLCTLPLLTASPAHADPKQFSAVVTVGSDTIQSVEDALAGESNGYTYTPIKSSATSGNRQIAAWDAFVGSGTGAANTCITPKAPGATIFRPNGSGNGLKALSRAIDGAQWGGSNCGGSGNGKAVAGLVDVARSSKGPASGDTGTALDYIPFALDALDFAYYAPGGSPVTSLTAAQLQQIFTSTTAGNASGVTIGGKTFYACGIQTGAGTFGAWNTALGASTAQEAGAVTSCTAQAITGGRADGRLEEHDSAGLKAKGDAMAAAGTVPNASSLEVIVGMGAGPFMSQWNGVAPSHVASGVDLGSISDDSVSGGGANIGKPYTGTVPSSPANPASQVLTPSSTYYASTTFARKVYNVLDDSIVSGPGNNDIKELFVGPTSAICSSAAQTNIVNLFGFVTMSSGCGDTSKKGSLIATNGGL